MRDAHAAQQRPEPAPVLGEVDGIDGRAGTEMLRGVGVVLDVWQAFKR
jgi:hypothetical protein